MYRIVAYGLLAVVLGLLVWKHQEINEMMGVSSSQPSEPSSPAGAPESPSQSTPTAPPPVDFKM